MTGAVQWAERALGALEKDDNTALRAQAEFALGAGLQASGAVLAAAERQLRAPIEPRQALEMIAAAGESPRLDTDGIWALDRRGGLGEDLSHQHVRALRATPETALPHELRTLASSVRLESGAKHLVERRRPTMVAALLKNSMQIVPGCMYTSYK